ncbi:MAG: sulfatase [Actinomycetota bacterium]|nr:sulfatase [Actinomycetota bacterium]
MSGSARAAPAGSTGLAPGQRPGAVPVAVALVAAAALGAGSGAVLPVSYPTGTGSSTATAPQTGRTVAAALAPWACPDLVDPPIGSTTVGSYPTLASQYSCFGELTRLGVRAATGERSPLTGGAPVDQSADKKPNVALIMLDDMRQDELSGAWMKRTRQLVGSQGVRVPNSVAPSPLCVPARASLLTGQYPHNHGTHSHHPAFNFNVFDDSDTLATRLQAAGYHTSFLGKYLNGYERKGGNPYVPPGWDDWRGSTEGTYQFFANTLNENGTMKDLKGSYQTKAYARIGATMLRRAAQQDKPFFAYLNFTAPHIGSGRKRPEHSDLEPTTVSPVKTHGKYDDVITQAPGYPGEIDISDKPRRIRAREEISPQHWDAIRDAARTRAEALSVVDGAVARYLSTLRKQGVLDDTYVIFTSDNGFFLGEHRIKHGKVLPYDEALRTPLLIRGPGIAAGSRTSAPFLSTDFAPTILDWAGAGRQVDMDGTSMREVLEGRGQRWRRPVLYNAPPKGSQGPAAPRQIIGVRTRDFLYTEYVDGDTELYDLTRDPKQETSLHDVEAYDGIRRQLATLLGEIESCRGADCNAPLPDGLRR